ncbi:MAG: 4-alpha-glucanotransferase [Rhodothermales bacterium]|nr:4-alpha-glucanotransferase [Rhodothermales bacterium]
MADYRASGVLLHITSLPGRYGIGDFGPGAYDFADFLVRADQKLWQLLPLVPVGHGYSPYSSPSTFAINPLLISPDLLVEIGLLTSDEVANIADLPVTHVDFESVIKTKTPLLRAAHTRFLAVATPEMEAAYEKFCERESNWLTDYALFMTIRSRFGDGTWTDWPPKLRDRDTRALHEVAEEMADEVDLHRFWQFIAYDQWSRLRGYCNELGIRIVGDIPIYVAHDSADVWAHPDLFQLDAEGQPTVVAGVPPDYFSETGQRWGNPIYRWDVMEERGYEWWVQRLQSILNQVDVVRLDHFRGFQAYWEVPASEPTAVKGRWVDGPGSRLFEVLRSRLGQMPIIAEDLGLITHEVVELMQKYGFPGMAVLQFAFDNDADDKFLPHNFHRNLVAYSGTHDNDTVHGWYRNDMSTQESAQVERARQYCRQYLNIKDGKEHVLHWEFIRALSMSVADSVIFPLQDVLGLGTEARMNVPGEATGNWSWRFDRAGLTDVVADRLRRITISCGRGRSAVQQEVWPG